MVCAWTAVPVPGFPWYSACRWLGVSASTRVAVNGYTFGVELLQVYFGVERGTAEGHVQSTSSGGHIWRGRASILDL